MRQNISAGLLMYRENGGKLEVFLVHPGGPFFKNKDEGFWSLPKGEIHNLNDDLFQTALREFEEETNTRPDPNGNYIPLGYVTQRGGKTVHAWAFEGNPINEFKSNDFEMEWPPKSGQMQKFPECDRGEFFDPETAKKKLVPDQDKFVERLLKNLEDRSQNTEGFN